MTAVVVLTEHEVRQLVAEGVDLALGRIGHTAQPVEPALLLTMAEARHLLGGHSDEWVAARLTEAAASTATRRLYRRADVEALANQPKETP